MGHETIKESFVQAWDTFQMFSSDSFIKYIEEVNDTKVPHRYSYPLHNFEFNSNKFGALQAYQILFNNYTPEFLKSICIRYFDYEPESN